MEMGLLSMRRVYTASFRRTVAITEEIRCMHSLARPVLAGLETARTSLDRKITLSI